MTITALPTVPQRSDSSTFVTRREPFIEALGTFRTELNSTASVLNPLADPSTTDAATAVQGASTAVPDSTLAVTSKDAAVVSSNAALASANAAKASESSAKDSSVIATTAASDALIAANATANVVNKVSTIRPSTRPSLNLDFSNTETLDPRITFVRNSISSYIDYDGLLKYAPAGKPCFAYDPITGESLGLQIFESRTNLLTYSEQFNNAVWSKTASSISQNAVVAPDGTLTGDKLVEGATNDRHWVGQVFSTTSGSTYAASIYAKAGERSIIQASVSLSHLSTGGYANFDLANGSVSASSGVTASITAIGKGWYRCAIVFIADGTASANVSWFLQSSSAAARGVAYTGDGTSGLYIWGAQIEAGSFPTPYIPTTSSTTTRAADQVSISGVNFSSWYNQGEGTFFVEFSQPSNYTSGFQTVFSANDGTVNNNIVPAVNASADVINIEAYTSGSIVAGFYPSYTSGTSKIAPAYKLNNVNYSKDGSLGVTDKSATVPMVSQLNIGSNYSAGNSLNGYIKKLSYYPKRLSPTELIGLTA